MKNFFYFDDNIVYPDISPYMPEERYPEYPYSDYESLQESVGNSIYAAIRQLFEYLELDKEHKGTAEWNPLGEYITPGQTVLLKPNMVNHVNPAEVDDSRGMECLITHPSIVRCVFDYVFIALDGKGKIIVADAPIQGCDFEMLLKKTGYGKVFKYFKEKETAELCVETADLREVVHSIEDGRMLQVARKKILFGGIDVDLEENSYFRDMKNRNRLRVTRYAGRDTAFHHRKGHNEYRISEAALQADVIIDLPKPKTHRIAGYTAALKNMIGINARKEYLPHHQKGCKDAGGDEYVSNHAVLKWLNSTGNDILNWGLKKGYQKFAYNMNEVCRRLGKRLDQYEPERKKYGMWYGNDTIWRTILDLNYIVSYADKNGEMQKCEQRKVIHIGDMIVCGEKEGPLNPSYKKVGGLLFSESAIEFDFFVVKLMGFDYRKIPVLKNALENSHIKPKDIVFGSNNSEVAGNVEEMKYNVCFEPTSGWREVL